MRKLFLFSLAAALLVSVTSCEKHGNDGPGGGLCNLPHNAAPAGLTGGWVNNFVNRAQIIEAYNGNWLGSPWPSAKYISFTPDGKGTEWYDMKRIQYSHAATYAKGTIRFDPGSTAQSGSFTFHACQGHYKNWGSSPVDRDATAEELQNSLTHKYYYEMQGQWLRIQADGPVNEHSSSFKKAD